MCLFRKNELSKMVLVGDKSHVWVPFRGGKESSPLANSILEASAASSLGLPGLALRTHPGHATQQSGTGQPPRGWIWTCLFCALCRPASLICALH